MSIGLRWLAASRRVAGRDEGTAWAFPPRLVAVHGVAVTLAIALTVLTAITAGRG